MSDVLHTALATDALMAARDTFSADGIQHVLVFGSWHTVLISEAGGHVMARCKPSQAAVAEKGARVAGRELFESMRDV